MKRKFLILINPVSGGKKSNVLLEKVEKRLSCEGFEVEVSFTSDEKGFIQKIRDNWNEEITDTIAIGGDGTVNLAANIIHEKNVVLGIIPAGTGNDFIKMVNLGKNLNDQIDAIINGEVIEVDAGMCNNHVFLNGVGLGFDGQIVYDNLNRKSILKGHLKYYAQVLRILATYTPRQVSYEIDGKKYEDEVLLLSVANGTTFGGGFKLTPNAEISDGMLDINIIRQIAPLRRFWEVNKLTKGTHINLKEVTVHKGKEINIHGDNTIMAHIDGEYFGSPPYTIKILPKHLKIHIQRSV